MVSFWIPCLFVYSLLPMRRDMLVQWNALNFEVHRRQARHDIAVATFKEVDSGDDRAAPSNGGGDDIGQSRAQIGDSDRVVGGSKRRGTGGGRAVLVVMVAETACRAAEAVRRYLRPGTQYCKVLQIPKALLIYGLVNDGDAVCLGEQDCKRLLPIGREARVDIGLDNGGPQLFFTEETNARGSGQLNATANLLEIGEEVAQCVWTNTLYRHIAVGGAGQRGPGSGLDAIAEHLHTCPAQVLHAFDTDLATRRGKDNRAHRAQHGDELHDLRLDRGVGDHRTPLGQHSKIQTGLGGPDAGIWEVDLRALERSDAMGDIPLRRLINDATEERNGLQVKIDGARTDLTAAHDGDRDRGETMEQDAEQENGNTIAPRVRCGHIRDAHRGCVDAQLLVVWTLDASANRGKHLRCNIYIADGWHVYQRRGGIAKQGRDHRFYDKVFRPQALNLSNNRVPTLDTIRVIF